MAMSRTGAPVLPVEAAVGEAELLGLPGEDLESAVSLESPTEVRLLQMRANLSVNPNAVWLDSTLMRRSFSSPSINAS